MNKIFEGQEQLRGMWKLESGVDLSSIVRERVKFINEHKEEILTAFIAKYGFEPDEAVMIEKRRNDGGWEWSIERKRKV